MLSNYDALTLVIGDDEVIKLHSQLTKLTASIKENYAEYNKLFELEEKLRSYIIIKDPLSFQYHSYD